MRYWIQLKRGRECPSNCQFHASRVYKQKVCSFHLYALDKTHLFLKRILAVNLDTLSLFNFCRRRVMVIAAVALMFLRFSLTTKAFAIGYWRHLFYLTLFIYMYVVKKTSKPTNILFFHFLLNSVYIYIYIYSVVTFPTLKARSTLYF